ncbi:hypothetical protein [Microbacterium ureisolvens]|uniref:CU044_5270 family protein n=1 Tax=Microbacterium ureisolvens TaxID=2781186 RepID=A0ABS7I395_9MICO|nr:hypothetical protein [Microbacterium ureisolvens]MBW9111302.1 hypothetical protein [Microbacterium ureisolvens]
MNDDELTSRLRAARPQTARRGDALEPRYETLLKRIMAEPDADDMSGSRRISAWRGRPIWLVAASVLLVMVFGALGSIALLQPSPAVAATPRLLTPEPVDGTSKENLMRISDAAREPEPEEGGPIRFQTWALSFDPEAATPPQFIVPEEHEIEHLPDGGVKVTVRAGVPYDASGQPVAEPTPTPGTVLWSDVQSHGDAVRIFGPAPTEVADMAGFFDESGTVPARTSGEYFSAVRLLLSEQNLSNEQRAALIEFLATLPDVDVDGTVTDRLGRDGVAFSTESRSPGEYRDTLVLSPTGGILSYEVTYTGSSRTDIQAPAVIEYIAWE